MADLNDDEIRAASRASQAEHELRETDAAFAKVRAGLLEALATSRLGEQELREKCFLAVQALDAVKGVLLEVATSKAVVDHNALIRSILSGHDQG